MPSGGVTYIRMAVPDHGTGVILCAAKERGVGGLANVPSAIIRLDDRGQEIARLDAAKADVPGGIFYKASGCIPWQDGYVVVAREPRPPGEADDFGHIAGGLRDRTTVMRLRADLSIQWRKPIPVNPNPVAATAGPRVLANGNVILPGLSELFLVDGGGAVKTRAEFPPCKWLRSVTSDSRIRLACVDVSPKASATIYQYDDTLRVVGKLSLGTEEVGLPVVIELADGSFAVLGNGENYQPPFVVLYSAAGKKLNKYTYLKKWSSHGNVLDGVATGPAQIATLRVSEHQGHFISIISWLNTK